MRCVACETPKRGTFGHRDYKNGDALNRNGVKSGS